MIANELREIGGPAEISTVMKQLRNANIDSTLRSDGVVSCQDL
jgi:hypothetical protein